MSLGVRLVLVVVLTVAAYVTVAITAVDKIKTAPRGDLQSGSSISTTAAAAVSLADQIERNCAD